ncbi:MAG: divergent polysaccharide deacetylase family protein [Pseudomonadota bacterium]
MFRGFFFGTFWGLVIGLIGLAVASVIAPPLPGSDRAAFETSPQADTENAPALGLRPDADQQASVPEDSQSLTNSTEIVAPRELPNATSSQSAPETSNATETASRPAISTQTAGDLSRPAVGQEDPATSNTANAATGLVAQGLDTQTPEIAKTAPQVPSAAVTGAGAVAGLPEKDAPEVQTQANGLGPKPNIPSSGGSDVGATVLSDLDQGSGAGATSSGSGADGQVALPSGPSAQNSPASARTQTSANTPNVDLSVAALDGETSIVAPSGSGTVVLTPVLPSPQTALPTAPAPSATAVDGQTAQTASSVTVTETGQLFRPKVSNGLPGQRVSGLSQSQSSSATGFGDRAPTVRVLRPGSVSGQTIGDQSSAQTEASASDGTEAKASQGALLDHAAEFTRQTELPVVSIVLVDSGGLTFALDALSNFGHPVTIALDPNASNATDLMSSYRGAGIEVMAVLDLPPGSRPQDLEVSFEAYAAALPEAIGYLDRTGASLGGGTALRGQAADIFAERGLAYLSTRRGFDAVATEMERGGVPVRTAERDLGDTAQDVREVRRQLDQVAFAAAQNGTGAVVVAQIHPTIISGLLLWGVSQRAKSVEIVPVSQLLLAR